MNKLQRKISEIVGNDEVSWLHVLRFCSGYVLGVVVGILLLPITIPCAIVLHFWLRKQIKDYGLHVLNEQFRSYHQEDARKNEAIALQEIREMRERREKRFAQFIGDLS
jgi:hypothetical protein